MFFCSVSSPCCNREDDDEGIFIRFPLNIHHQFRCRRLVLIINTPPPTHTAPDSRGTAEEEATNPCQDCCVVTACLPDKRTSWTEEQSQTDRQDWIKTMFMYFCPLCTREETIIANCIESCYITRIRSNWFHLWGDSGALGRDGICFKTCDFAFNLLLINRLFIGVSSNILHFFIIIKISDFILCSTTSGLFINILFCLSAHTCRNNMQTVSLNLFISILCQSLLPPTHLHHYHFLVQCHENNNNNPPRPKTVAGGMRLLPGFSLIIWFENQSLRSLPPQWHPSHHIRLFAPWWCSICTKSSEKHRNDRPPPHHWMTTTTTTIYP